MIACIQMNSSADVSENLATVEQQIKTLPKTRPLLVCLPECFALFDGGEQAQCDFAEQKKDQAVTAQLAQWCQQYDIWLVAGTMPISVGNKYHAASLVINNQGKVIAQYNKMHLFDVSVNDNTKHYLESLNTQAGQDIVVVDTPFGRLGVAVCYDIRFPGLFATMRDMGAELIVLPAAFTVPTGKAHWQPLLQARAIENQVYMIAPAMVGTHHNGRQTYGHSMIVNPWGEVVAQRNEGVGSVVYLPDIAQLHAIREKMPVAIHNRFNYEFKQ